MLPAHVDRVSLPTPTTGAPGLSASFLLPAVLGILAACGGGDAPADGWTGTVDTLANGAVRVTSVSGAWAAGDAWSLVEELRIGHVEGSGPTVFGNVAGVTVARSGRIYILDGQARELRAFAPDGSHLWSAGREGQGPGEFSAPVGLAVGPGGNIWVVDRGNQRFPVYDTSGAFVRDVPRGRSGPFSGWRGGFDPEGRLLDPSLVEVEPRRFGTGVVRTTPTFEPAETFAVPSHPRPTLATLGGGTGTGARMRLAYPAPHSPELIWHPDPATGTLWIGLTEPYRIAQVSFGGDTLRVVGRPAERLPLTEADRAAIDATLEDIREGGGTPDLSLIPDDKPRARWLEPAPDGHLWVRVHSTTGQPAYDVFGPDGRWLGEVTSPVDLKAGLAFGAGVVVGVTRDALDVPYVVRLRVVRP